jgi:N4-gp56 family major capsid protein
MPDPISQMNATTAADMAEMIPEIYSQKVYQETLGRMYWTRFSGEEGSGMPVIVKRELVDQPGDTIQISQLINLPDDSGVNGEETLMGKEQKLTPRSVTTTPDWKRNAVSETHKVKKQITFAFRDKAQIALGNWMAKKRDSGVWAAALATGNQGWEKAPIAQVFGGGSSDVNDVDPADVFSVELIRRGVAKLTDNHVARIKLPDMPDGEGYYLCFVNPWQAYSLRKDPDWIANYRSAGERGATNPLFTGAMGEVAGAIVHETTQCSAFANAASPAVTVAGAVMVGAECLCTGEAEDVNWYEEETDYGFRHGIAISAAWEDLVLSSEGIIQIYTAAVDQTK